MLLSDYLGQVTDPGSGLSRQQLLQVLLDTENLLRSHLETVLQVPGDDLPEIRTEDAEAMLPAPYDRLYIYALEAAICYALGENARHDNAMTLYALLLEKLDLAVMYRYRPAAGPALRFL